MIKKALDMYIDYQKSLPSNEVEANAFPSQLHLAAFIQHSEHVRKHLPSVPSKKPLKQQEAEQEEQEENEEEENDEKKKGAKFKAEVNANQEKQNQQIEYEAYQKMNCEWSSHSFTPLHLAVFNRDIKVLELLLEFGADYDLLTSDHQSVLHLAVLLNNLEACKLLLQKFSNPPQALLFKNKHSVHALQMSMTNTKDSRILRFFLQYLHSQTYYPLFDLFNPRWFGEQNPVVCAFQAQNATAVWLLSKMGFEITSELWPIIWPSALKTTQMFDLAFSMCSEKLKKVIETNQNGIFELCQAAINNGNLSMLQHLVTKFNFDILMDVENIGTLLRGAISKGMPHIFNWLVTRKAKVDDIDDEGLSMISVAVQAPSMSILKSICELAPSMINQPNDDIQNSYTPLFYLVSLKGDKERMQCLIEKGADISLKFGPSQINILQLAITSWPENEQSLEAFEYLLQVIESVQPSILIEPLKNKRTVALLAAENLKFNFLLKLLQHKGLNAAAVIPQMSRAQRLAQQKHQQQLLIQQQSSRVQPKKVYKSQSENEYDTLLHLIVRHSESIDQSLFERLVHSYLSFERTDINRKNMNGNTAIHLAFAYETVPIERVKFLIDLKGIELNTQNSDGLTCFHYAILSKSLPKFELLLEKNAQFSKDIYGLNPL